MTVRLVLEVVAAVLGLAAVSLIVIAWRKAGELLRDLDRENR